MTTKKLLKNVLENNDQYWKEKYEEERHRVEILRKDGDRLREELNGSDTARSLLFMYESLFHQGHGNDIQDTEYVIYKGAIYKISDIQLNDKKSDERSYIRINADFIDNI